MTDTIDTDIYYEGPPAGDFVSADDPFALFDAWMEDAKAHEINDPNAMSLATVDDDGMPNVRIVLLKEVDPSGFTFYTNHESQKGNELLSQKRAALCLYWKSLRRQVRVRGTVERVTDAEVDAYFARRPRGSRIGAWASAQSRPLADRATLEETVEKFDARYPGEDVPRPPHWSGFRLAALEIEFWHNRPYRLHERVQFRRPSIDQPWKSQQLWP